MVLPLTDVVQIEVGDLSACALQSSGTVTCWGLGPFDPQRYRLDNHEIYAPRSDGGFERQPFPPMRSFKGHVRNGHVVVDEPTELPEGPKVVVVGTKVVDPFEGMSADEHVELEQELEAGRRDFDNGNHVDARAFVAELLAKP